MVKISNFSISTRIFFSAIIPLAAVIVLGAYVALDEFSRYRSLDKLQRLAEIAPEISAVVHVLQRERGMSAGYVSNNGKGVWRENLADQQAATDMQLSTSLPILSNFPTESYGEAVNENLSRALASIAQIDDIRSKTNGLRTPGASGYDFRYWRACGQCRSQRPDHCLCEPSADERTRRA